MFNPAGTWWCLSRDQAAGGEESQGSRALHPGTEVGSRRNFIVLYVSPWSSSIKGKKMVQREILKYTEELCQQWHTGAAQGVHVGRSWAAEAAWSQPELFKASCVSTVSKV